MVKYGDKHLPDDAPTSSHVRRVERKYRGHKLAQAVGHNYEQRKHGGESTKHQR